MRDKDHCLKVSSSSTVDAIPAIHPTLCMCVFLYWVKGNSLENIISYQLSLSILILPKIQVSCNEFFLFYL